MYNLYMCDIKIALLITLVRIEYIILVFQCLEFIVDFGYTVNDLRSVARPVKYV